MIYSWCVLLACGIEVQRLLLVDVLLQLSFPGVLMPASLIFDNLLESQPPILPL